MPLHTHRIDSKLLAGNPLGDPAVRDLTVYVPSDLPDKPIPALLAVVGFTGRGRMLFNDDALGEGLDRRMDRLIASGACPPVIIAAPDCFTRVGGNQYINSSAVGPYEDHLLQEIVPFVNAHYDVSRWGVFGKSSGGYGSIVLGMRHPDVFEALADHSGDSNFELCYLADFPGALSAWREAGGPTPWLDAFWKADNRKQSKYMHPLNALAMTAFYSPNPASPHLGVDFPFDLETGRFRPDVWERWRAWDPVNMVSTYAAGMKRLRGIYIDCGTRDEYGLIWGARALSAGLRAAGLEVTYEEFDDGHMNIPYRYDRSVPFLVKSLL